MTAPLNVENIRARTAESRAANTVSEVEVVLDSEKQKLQDIANAANADLFGCNRPAVRALVESMLGVILPAPVNKKTKRRKFNFIVGSVIRYKSMSYLVRELDSDGDGLILAADLSTETSDNDTFILACHEDRADGTDIETATTVEVERFLVEIGLA